MNTSLQSQLMHFQANNQKLSKSYKQLAPTQIQNILNFKKCAIFPINNTLTHPTQHPIYSLPNKHTQTSIHQHIDKTHQKSKSSSMSPDSYLKKGGFWNNIRNQQRNVVDEYNSIENQVGNSMMSEDKEDSETYVGWEQGEGFRNREGLKYLREVMRVYEANIQNQESLIQSQPYNQQSEQESQSNQLSKQNPNRDKTIKKRTPSSTETKPNRRVGRENMQKINDAPKKHKKYRRVILWRNPNLTTNQQLQTKYPIHKSLLLTAQFQ